MFNHFFRISLPSNGVVSVNNAKLMGGGEGGSSLITKNSSIKYKALSQIQVKKYNLLSKTFFNNLNFDEQQSLLMYTYRSRDINRKLSGEDHIKQVFYENIDDVVKNLDGVLLKFKLEDDILVFKGANRRYFKDLKVGQIFKPNYYFSTSVDKNVAESFAQNKRNKEDSLMIEIKVPSVSKAVYVGEDSGWLNHKEIILDRTTKYKVLSFNGDKLELEVINDN